jgi:hypothetical protein
MDSLFCALTDLILFRTISCSQLTSSLSSLVVGALGGLAVGEPPYQVTNPQLDLFASIEYASLLPNKTFPPGSQSEENATSIAFPPTGASGFLTLGFEGEEAVGVGVTVTPALGGTQPDIRPLSRVIQMTVTDPSSDTGGQGRRRRLGSSSSSSSSSSSLSASADAASGRGDLPLQRRLESSSSSSSSSSSPSSSADASSDGGGRGLQRRLSLLSLGAYVEASIALARQPDTKVRPVDKAAARVLKLHSYPVTVILIESLG